jgi:hypothetical protein
MAADREPDVSRAEHEHLAMHVQALTRALRALAEADLYGTDDPGYRMALEVQHRRHGLHVVRDGETP